METFERNLAGTWIRDDFTALLTLHLEPARKTWFCNPSATVLCIALADGSHEEFLVRWHNAGRITLGADGLAATFSRHAN